MGRKRTPKPIESGWPIGCLIAAGAAMLAILIILKLSIDLFSDIRVLSILGIFASSVALMLFAGAIFRWLYGKALLALAHRKWNSSAIIGILSTSNSPNWQEYIKQQWIAPFGDHFIVMNYSEYSSWKPSLVSKLLRHYLGNPRKYETLNYNPAVVLFRGLRRPYIYRFFYAFRDAKHGNREALEKLEKHLFAEIEKRRKIAR